MPLSSRQEDIRTKIAFSLAKHINWRTKKLKHKAYARIAEELVTFGVLPYYMGSIWRKHKLFLIQSTVILSRAWRLYQAVAVTVRFLLWFYAKVKAVPFHFCKNVQTLACKVGIPKSMIHNELKKGILKHIRNTIRPILTDKNKAERWCTAVALYRTVRLLTCWRRWILTRSPNVQTQESYRKGYVSHCTVAWQQQNPQNGEWWDEKIGTCFFVEQIPAKRTSKNRPAGTLKTKSFKVGKKESIEMYMYLNLEEP